MIEMPNAVRSFLSIGQDAVYTVIPDGFGTFILVYNDAHGDVKIVGERLDAEAILKNYDIKL